MSRRFRRLPAALVAVAAIGVSAFSVSAVSAATPSTPTARTASAPSSGLQCTPGLSPTLSFTDDASSSVTTPFSVLVPANGSSVPAGYGSNPSSVGYDATVSSSNSTASFGLKRTGDLQGVPWNNISAEASQGKVEAWLVKLDEAGNATVTIIYDKPVYGMRTAIADLDNGDETMQLNAFAEKSGGTAIPLDVEALKNPEAIPELAPDQTHTGNTAYVVDDAAIAAKGDNTFSSTSAANTDTKSGSVFFAFDSESPVQRVEMTYTATKGRAFFFVPPSVPQACVQPNFAIGEVSEGGTATLTSTIANQAGSGRVEDIGFTYTLPEGVVVADDPKIVAPACAGTVTAVPGSSTVTVSGASSAAGASACDWSVDLKFTTPGKVTFDGSMITGASNVVAGNMKATTVEVIADAPALTSTFEAALAAGGNGKPKAGDSVVFTAKVTNTGNTPLTSIDPVDSLSTGLVCADLPLAVGDTATCVSDKPHVLTQGDLDAGTVTNELTATAMSATGKAAAATAVSASLPIAATPLIVSDIAGKLDKAEKVVQAGDTVTYSSTVTNSGTVTVSTVAVTDDLGTMMSCAATTLAPGESTECVSTTPYPLTQADIDAGVLRNGSAAAGVAPSGDEVASMKQSFEIELAAKAAATSSIAVNPAEGTVGVGTQVSYVLTVTNTGNVSLTADQLTGSLGTVFTCAGPVAPGASIDCVSTEPYVLTQADVDAGKAVNTVTGSMRTPGGKAVEVPQAKGVLEIKASPALSADASGSITAKQAEMVLADDTLVYTATVTNTGNVTLSTVGLTKGGHACDAVTLAPGESTLCAPAAVTLDQDDIDAGSVVTSFVFEGVAPSGDRVEAASTTVHTPIAAVPAVETTTSSKLDEGSNTRADAGDTVTYSVKLKNTGNVTLQGASLLGSLGTVFVCGDIAPGAEVECVGDVPASITQEQLDAGLVVNSISGNVSTKTAVVVDIPTVDETTVLAAAPGLDAEESTSLRPLDGAPATPLALDGKTLVVPGDGLQYVMTIENTGNVTITDLGVDEWHLTGLTCTTASIAPGEQVECVSQTPYSIVQADIDAGEVVHKATAKGRAPIQADVQAPADAETPATGEDAESGAAQMSVVSADAAAPVEGKLVRSGEITTVTPLAPVPAPPTLAITGSTGGLGAAFIAALALMTGFVGLLLAKRRKRDEDETEQATITR